MQWVEYLAYWMVLYLVLHWVVSWADPMADWSVYCSVGSLAYCWDLLMVNCWAAEMEEQMGKLWDLKKVPMRDGYKAVVMGMYLVVNLVEPKVV